MKWEKNRTNNTQTKQQNKGINPWNNGKPEKKRESILIKTGENFGFSSKVWGKKKSWKFCKGYLSNTNKILDIGGWKKRKAIKIALLSYKKHFHTNKDKD